MIVGLRISGQISIFKIKIIFHFYYLNLMVRWQWPKCHNLRGKHLLWAPFPRKHWRSGAQMTEIWGEDGFSVVGNKVMFLCTSQSHIFLGHRPFSGKNIFEPPHIPAT